MFPCRQSSVAGFATQLFSFRRCPHFLVGEVTPNECDWEQPGVAHGILPADLTRVSQHISCVAPCLNTRLGNHRHDVMKFPAPKTASFLNATTVRLRSLSRKVSAFAVPAFAVPAFAAGKRAEFQRHYAEDLARLQAQLPATARWVDSHCHLESILQRSWRRGGKPQVLESENLVSLEELVALWPPRLDGCISNHVLWMERRRRSWRRR